MFEQLVFFTPRNGLFLNFLRNWPQFRDHDGNDAWRTKLEKRVKLASEGPATQSKQISPADPQGSAEADSVNP